LRRGLAQAVHDPGLAAARADLLLGGIEILPVEKYERITQLEVEAKRLGYRDFDLQNGT
jgi:hypothetical protein